MNEPELWDTRRVAAFLGIAEHSLDGWAYKGIGPRYFKVGSRRRYRPADVAAWLDAQAVETR